MAKGKESEETGEDAQVNQKKRDPKTRLAYLTGGQRRVNEVRLHV